ncbi:MAG: hypothetical protein MJ090_04995 [Clostridia bacterium]|nr:hypothetical protein [Clostridia bacterium]
MSELVLQNQVSGDVYLYDIDLDAAKKNEIIGNKFNDSKDCNAKWNYKAVETIGEALKGAVVETNVIFRTGNIKPVLAGPIPKEIYPLVSRVCGEQEALNEAIAERDVEKIFEVFSNDALVTCNLKDARKLFEEMLENTKEYLTMYKF